MFFFKHSTTCPISHGAYTEFQAYCSEEREVPAYYLYVQDARDVSNRVAEQYSIRHESPQVLYIKDGMVVWNTSHWNIKKRCFRREYKVKKKQAKGACFFFLFLLKYI